MPRSDTAHPPVTTCGLTGFAEVNDYLSATISTPTRRSDQAAKPPRRSELDRREDNNSMQY